MQTTESIILTHTHLVVLSISNVQGAVLCLPIELNMHPNRLFPGHFVVHMPSCLHVLLCVSCPLRSLVGAEGTVPLGMFPWGCEDTVARRWLLSKGGGVVEGGLLQ